jgi:hypothetical protein
MNSVNIRTRLVLRAWPWVKSHNPAGRKTHHPCA